MTNKVTQLLKHHQLEGYASSNIPLYYASTYKQEQLGGETTFDYARSGNPNRKYLEEQLADLEGGQYGFAFSSGIAAVTAVFLTLKAGDHVIMPDDVYGGTFRLTEQILSKFGLTFTVVDQSDLSQIKQALQANTRLIYVETPSNPLFKVADIQAICNIAKQHRCLIAVDNTFMTPLGQSPLEHGADFVIHSATKFLSGHSDVIAGAVITNDAHCADQLYLIQNGTGSGLGVYDAWTLTNHLKTLPVRFQQSVEYAEAIYQFLSTHPAVQEVYYPGNNPVHVKQATCGGAVIGFRIRDETKAQQFVDHLKLPLVSVSLGGVETILSHPATMSHAAVPEFVRRKRGITDGLFRLSVGLEHPEDLINDLDFALRRGVYDDTQGDERTYISG
ncbi:trans-sulfuration enzyme family protein [Macrococcus capreoli]|uniref:trans-sulfuration enzyme family protein n=1 Tax=Macrococcus capreoli TaxID=2982690 RepID=UPI003F43FE67